MHYFKPLHRLIKPALLIRSLSVEILLPRGQLLLIQTVVRVFLKVIAPGSALHFQDSYLRACLSVSWNSPTGPHSASPLRPSSCPWAATGTAGSPPTVSLTARSGRGPARSWTSRSRWDSCPRGWSYKGPGQTAWSQRLFRIRRGAWRRNLNNARSIHSGVTYMYLYSVYNDNCYIFKEVGWSTIPHHLYYQLVFSEKKSELIYNI